MFAQNLFVWTFEGEMFEQMWLILDENSDLHICGMFAHFTSKLNLCTFDGVMFVH